jgi:serine/threonine-protein kinase
MAAELIAVIEAASSTSALDSPASVFAAPFLSAEPLDRLGANHVGSAFGPYRVIRLLGQGGMGSVYLAERADDQYRKEVALKVLPFWGVSDSRRMHRFVEERQILASLDHPHIARLLDGGVTSDGLPWFAMEYVGGVPIDDHCNARELSVEARLALFCHVCSAVQYAHRNLVVHRDLKPTNILVSADGRVALLDFGIAKLLADGDGTQAPLTATGDRLLTPLFASPEQLRGEPVSTATDVYSLGVLLHVLLTGGYPYRLTSNEGYVVARAVLEQEPERPSSAVKKGGNTGESAHRLALVRRTTLPALSKRLHGDLDAIVTKALEKDPSRRYATVEQLEADVRRHLSGLPIIARPASRLYLARKFVGRHRSAVGVAVVVTALVLTFTAITVVQRSRLRVQAQRIALNPILAGLLRGAAPSAPGRGVTAVEVLDAASVEVDTRISDPTQRAKALLELGQRYLQVDELERARRRVDSALHIQRQLARRGDRSVARSVDLLGTIALAQGDLSRAAEAFTEALSLRRRDRGAEGEIARSLVGLSTVRKKQGRLAEAESLALEAVDLDGRRRGDGSTDLAQSTSALGSVLLDRRDYTGAQRQFRRELGLLHAMPGDDDIAVATAQLNLAAALHGAGKYSAADSLIRSALRISQRLTANAVTLHDSLVPSADPARRGRDVVAPVRGPLSRSAPDATVAASAVGDGTWIVFTSDRDDPYRAGHPGNEEVYVMRADGSDTRRLTHNEGMDTDADWSSDGTRIVFVSHRGGSQDVFVMNADGTGQRRVTNLLDTLDAAHPTWSPDGQRFVFRSKYRYSLYVVNVDGTGLARIATRAAAPAWSPDGRRIAFNSTKDGNPEIYLMNPDGRKVVRLTVNDANDYLPAWSPDGTRIAFNSDRDGNSEIYVMNVDGTNPVRLTNNPSEDEFPSWSPDGRRIVFQRRVLGHMQVFTMKADGSDERQLTDASPVAFSGLARWSPIRR